MAAAWLHKATQESQYLQDAKGFSSGSVPWALSWDDTNVAADVSYIIFTGAASAIHTAHKCIQSTLNQSCIYPAYKC